MTSAANALRDGLAARLTAIVSRKLNTPVTFARWIQDATGADIPLFNVPADSLYAARALGIRVADEPLH